MSWHSLQVALVLQHSCRLAGAICFASWSLPVLAELPANRLEARLVVPAGDAPVTSVRMRYSRMVPGRGPGR